jgi:hypothetical protein
MILRGENQIKTCPSAILPITNPTWTDRGTIPGFCSERPAANGLSHGMVQCYIYIRFYSSKYNSAHGLVCWAHTQVAMQMNATHIYYCLQTFEM